MKKLILLAIYGALILVACKKENPDDINPWTESEYYVNGAVDFPPSDKEHVPFYVGPPGYILHDDRTGQDVPDAPCPDTANFNYLKKYANNNNPIPIKVWIKIRRRTHVDYRNPEGDILARRIVSIIR